jgi:hypothetical protein
MYRISVKLEWKIYTKTYKDNFISVQFLSQANCSAFFYLIFQSRFLM